MSLNEVEDNQIGSKENDSFCILSREYLPKERCLMETWNNEVRIRIQYEFTNHLPVLFLSENSELVKRSQSCLQKIVFELLTSVLYYLDIPYITAIEFLENCSIVSYLKICKILGYDFIGKDELDIQEVPTESLKDEFNVFISDPSKAIDINLPSFRSFVEDHITPLIMDAVWLIQMSVNSNESNKNSIWIEFMSRLCRGNITSRERPLQSIPKSVKLISIKDIVSYLDLGKSDNMKITESLISSKFKLQQKYVRDRTRLCFTVDSFTTQRECLNGFSILGVLIKYLFDQVNFFSDLNIDEPTFQIIYERNYSKNPISANFLNEYSENVADKNDSNTNLNQSNYFIKSIWDIILRYDLSIQRSVGLIFEVFISTISSFIDTKNNLNDLDTKLFVLLDRLLAIFPRKIVRKSFIIFIEHVSNICSSNKRPKESDSLNTENIGNYAYRTNPWIITDKKEFKDILNLPFFVLTSFLIKKRFFELSNYFKEKLVEWDDIFWSDFKVDKYSLKSTDNFSNLFDAQSFFFPPKTLENINSIYKYYHLYFNSQLSKIEESEKDLNLELLLREILRNERINDEINFSNISIILSELILTPSILFANSFFADYFSEEICDNEDEICFASKILKNSEIIQEITDYTGMPFSIINLSSNILKKKIELIINDIESKVKDHENSSNLILQYKRFYSLTEWISKYCKYYLFQKHPSCIPIFLELNLVFVKEFKNGKLSELFESKELSSINGYKCPFELLFEVSSCIIFPAISLLPKSPSIPEMLKKSIFGEIDIKYRYQIYRRLMVYSYNRYPMNYQWVSVKKILSKYLKGVTKDIINSKNDNKHSNSIKRRPPVQIRLLISNIIGLCYTNPLAVCDTIINQCNNYDNMIPLLIEILGNNIDEICFDVMIFTIINFILSRPTCMIDCRSSSSDLNCSRFGNRGIAKFAALLLTKRKVPREILKNFLQTITYRIDETFNGKEYSVKIPNNFLDICFWKQLLEIVLSAPILDLSVLTGKQIQSLAGGPLLFQIFLSQHEEDNFGAMSEHSFFSSLLDNNSYAKQNCDLFISILKNGEIQSKEVLFRIAKLRSEILWDVPSNLNMDIKLLINLSDELHWCCIQTIELLKRSFDPESYRNFILNISNSTYSFEEIVNQTFLYLDIPTAWSFLRNGIRKSNIIQVDREVLIQKQGFLDIDHEAIKCIKIYILKKNGINFLNNEIFMDFYLLFWYLDLSDISLPYQHYSEKLFELYSEILFCKENIDRILAQNIVDYRTDTLIEKCKMESFLNPNNIKLLPSYTKNKNHLTRQVRDAIKPFEKRLRRLYSCYNALASEYIKLSKRSDLVSQFLDSDCGIKRFKDEFNESFKCHDFPEHEKKIQSFMIWICKDFIAPRVIHSETDALFTYFWIERFVLDDERGIFSSNKYLIESFLILTTKHISSLIRSSTPRESQLLGLFFKEIFAYIKRFISKFRSNINTDNKQKEEIIFKVSPNNIPVTDLNSLEFETDINGKNSNEILDNKNLLIDGTKYSEAIENKDSDCSNLFEKKSLEYFDQKMNLINESSQEIKLDSSMNEPSKLDILSEKNESNNGLEYIEIFKGKSYNEIESLPQRTTDSTLNNFLYECEKNIMISLSLGLGLLSERSPKDLPEWAHTLSSVWMLSRFYESFPISAITGEFLLKELPKILEYATKRHWNDLNLSITSLILKLKQCSPNWVRKRDLNDKNSKQNDSALTLKVSIESTKKNNFSSSNLYPTVPSSKNHDEKIKNNPSRSELKRQRLNVDDYYLSKTNHSSSANSIRREEHRKK
ncbi:Transcription factor/nuclear export subunit protein 2 family protein [Cryptosporidium meleagridis]|uniref:Transcription factor/nuclear export subunit protein 2 family protein n=1 Tax=Cryptosporidium meleagridis TaxID=93969 RepID=A0A2P4YYB1_9CRYT|nr:Transcription factor/nuclear export subunit protein 2 family protein [Cryptosporidium meleagridis]